MSAEELLEEIFTNRLVYDDQGNSFPLEANLDLEEGIFLQNIIKELQPLNTIEVGCAYGISSLFICSELAKIKKSYHTIIDPFQNSDWKGIGITNLNRANIDFYNLIEQPSEIALPKLLSEGREFDFAFIDGWHTFDHTMIDFFYLNRLLKVGGVIVIDDVGMDSVNKLVRYVLNYPAYKMIGQVGIEVSPKRKLFNLLCKSPFQQISKILPSRIQHEIFSGSLIQSNEKLKLNSSMVALKKVTIDDRPWNWYREF